MYSHLSLLRLTVVWVTCDICGLRLISFRLMVCGLRLFSSWHSSTPSRRVCAKSNTCAVSAVTRWFAGSTLQLISHVAHCLQYSMLSERPRRSVSAKRKHFAPVSSLRAARSSLRTPASPLEGSERCWDWNPPSLNFPFLVLRDFLRGGRNSRELN